MGEDLAHQLTLTRLLQSVQPDYAPIQISSAADFLNRIAEVTSLPVTLCSYGATCAEVREI